MEMLSSSKKRLASFRRRTETLADKANQLHDRTGATMGLFCFTDEHGEDNEEFVFLRPSNLVRVFVKYLESDSAPGLGDLNEVEKQIQRHLDVISVINNSMSQLVFNVGRWEQRVRSASLRGLSAKIDDYKARVQHLLDLSEAADAQEAANAQ
ncbi:unnamed protein product [Arabidopsis halleri]